MHTVTLKRKQITHGRNPQAPTHSDTHQEKTRVQQTSDLFNTVLV